jgi:hypothetical protein
MVILAFPASSEEVLDNEARVNAQLTVAYVRLQRL